MNKLLSALPDFFYTSAGIAVLAVVACVLAVLIIDLNYRLFMKYVLDFIFSLIALIVLSPVFAVTAIIVKYRLRGEGGSVIERSACIGVKGKIIYVHSFAVLECGLKNLPRLLDVFSGRLSIVGPRILAASDSALIEDEYMDRFSVRPGIIVPLSKDGYETYEEMFLSDLRYIKKRELFKDICTVLYTALLTIRGEYKNHIGEACFKSYSQVLLERGSITPDDASKAAAYADEAIKNSIRY